MLDLRSARDRAMRRAIETGHMPNMDIIHARQKMEGYDPCFGRTDKVCQRTGCRWHGDCAQLAMFRPVHGLGLRGLPRRTPAAAMQGTLGTFRDGHTTPETTCSLQSDAAVEPLPAQIGFP